MTDLAPRDVTAPAAQMHRYRAYGIDIESEIALPELERRTERGADLTIRRRPLTCDRSGNVSFDFGPEATVMWWREVGAFRIRADGRLIEVDPAPGVDDDLVAFPLLGPVLAMMLHRRGMFLLHASAVSVDGAGLVLLGDKGAGKSTTATALLSAGHRLIADDIVAFDPASGHLLPAFAQVKLSDQALSGLNAGTVEVRSAAHTAIDKHRVLIPDRFAAGPVPVSRICVLDRGADTALQPLERGEALRHLLRFGYMARFGGRAMDKGGTARHFMQAAALADRGIVCRLVLPDGLERLADAVGHLRDAMAGPAGSIA